MGIATERKIYCRKCGELMDTCLEEYNGAPKAIGYGICDLCWREGVCDVCKTINTDTCNECDIDEKEIEERSAREDYIYEMMKDRQGE